MRAGALVRPGERVRLAAEDQPHQLVVGGMEFDEVDAMAEAVVRAQLGQVPVGLARQVLDLGAADQGSGLLQVIRRPVGTEDANRVTQRFVAGIEVVIFERTRLVHHLMGGKASRLLVRA